MKYEDICLSIWGCIPKDKNWAINTNLYKDYINKQKMEKIPTAEQLMQANNGDDYTHWEEIHQLMIIFAKLHVKAALEAAAKNAKVKTEDYGNPNSDEWEKVIDGLSKGYSIEDVKRKYKLSSRIEKRLQEEIKKLQNGN